MKGHLASTSGGGVPETEATAPLSLTERLRSRAWEHRHHRMYRAEAADEIERLREAADNALNVLAELVRLQELQHTLPDDPTTWTHDDISTFDYIARRQPVTWEAAVALSQGTPPENVEAK